MSKPDLIREALIATLFILLLTYLLNFIPWSTEYRKVFRQGVGGFDIYDLYYSGKDKRIGKKDTNIVLLELGNNRSEIAEQINILNRHEPRVIALDVILETPNKNIYDSLGDQNLSAAITGKKNLVFAYRFANGDELRPNYFLPEVRENNAGYINFDGADNSVIRSYAPQSTIHGKKFQAFTTSIVRMYDEKLYGKFKKKNQERLLINYSGNINHFPVITREALYEYEQLGELDRVVKNKIVLVGFFVLQDENGQPPLVMDDLHFTPLSESISGKSYPDMYGVVIHANILSMIMSGHFAKMAPEIFSYFIAFAVCFFFIYFLIAQYSKKKHPAHFIFLVIQLVVIVLLLYLLLQVFNNFQYKIQMEPIIISMILSLEMVGLYKIFALWLNRKFHYQTIFKHK